MLHTLRTSIGGSSQQSLRHVTPAIIRRVAQARYSSTQGSNSTRPSPKQQLARVQQLIQDVGSVKATDERLSILGQYGDIRDILELVYDPNMRFHVTSRGLTTLLESPSNDVTDNITAPASLQDLFLRLSRGTEGGANKLILRAFLQQNEIQPGTKEYEVFGKLLDRHLQMGVSRNTIQKVQWVGEGVSGDKQGDPSSVHEGITGDTGKEAQTDKDEKDLLSMLRAAKSAQRNARLESVDSASSHRDSSGPTRPPVVRNLKAFSCALGQTILPPFKELSKRSHKWYASRKLDGVRVLALLDFHVPTDSSKSVRCAEAQFVSRQGNPFHSLARLEEQLRDLEGYPGLRELLDRDPMFIEEHDDGTVKRLVLDGEVCSMVPATHPVRMGDDGTGASALWENDGLTEDFASAVSLVKRHATMEQPMYFIFDVCPWIEVYEGEARRKDGEGLGKTFGERVDDTKRLCEWLRSEVGRNRPGEEPKVRALVQWPIDVGDVDAMVERAAAEGWEGLIFRADTPYKGKRSSDIRKFKKFQDAEYTVVDMDTSSMRLPIDGVYGIHEALSNVWIEHEGHRVSVGTGFTVDERIRFAKDPSQIVGKQITVEYFSESAAVGREGTKSLRFPRIKQIWGEDGRNI